MPEHAPPLDDEELEALPEAATAGSPPEYRSPKPPIRWLTYLVLLPLIGLATCGFGCVSLIAGLWDTSGRQQHAIARVWANTLLLLSLSPVRLLHPERLRTRQAAVYASNHLSYYDTPVLFSRLPFQFRILAKQSLWKTPFVGWYLNRSGQIPIDPNSGRSAIAGLLRGAKALQSGMPLVIFPEGGRTADGHMSPFQSGAAFMAIKAQVPLVPLALIGTYELLPMHTYHLTPRPLKIVVGNPISTEGLTTRDAETLTTQLFSAITAMLAANS